MFYVSSEQCVCGKEQVTKHSFHCLSIYYTSIANSSTSPTKISAYTRSIITSMTVNSLSATRRRVCASLAGPRAQCNKFVIIAGLMPATTFRMAATSTAITSAPRVTPAELAATRASIAVHALPSTGRQYGLAHPHPGPEVERCCGWSEAVHLTTRPLPRPKMSERRRPGPLGPSRRQISSSESFP